MSIWSAAVPVAWTRSLGRQDHVWATCASSSNWSLRAKGGEVVSSVRADLAVCPPDDEVDVFRVQQLGRDLVRPGVPRNARLDQHLLEQRDDPIRQQRHLFEGTGARAVRAFATRSARPEGLWKGADRQALRQPPAEDEP